MHCSAVVYTAVYKYLQFDCNVITQCKVVQGAVHNEGVWQCGPVYCSALWVQDLSIKEPLTEGGELKCSI